MCRLYGFHASALTKVECSLVHAQNALLHQSQQDEQGRRHPDGWGIACYGAVDEPGHRLPELVRHETAAFRDAHFSHTAESMYAQTVVAHVRLATVGSIGATNSHPFTHQTWTFAHNGTVTGFADLQDELARETGRLQDGRLGDTDSEQLFLWLLNRFVQDGLDLQAPEGSDLERSLAASITELAERCGSVVAGQAPRLTFVLTDGRWMIGCRWNNPLHWLQRYGVHDCEICGIPHIRQQGEADYRALVFASEPITSEAWQLLPNHSLCLVNPRFEASVTHLTDEVGV